MNQSYPKENKILIIFVSALLFCLVVGWILYNLFGHQLIRNMYEGNSIGILNRIIKSQDTLSLEYYFRKTTALFLIGNLFFIFISFFSFLFFTRNQEGVPGKLNRLFSTRIFNSKDILVLGGGFIIAIIFFHETCSRNNL